MDDTGDGAVEWASDRLTMSLTCTSLGNDDTWMRSEPACRLPTSFTSIEYLRSVHATHKAPYYQYNVNYNYDISRYFVPPSCMLGKILKFDTLCCSQGHFTASEAMTSRWDGIPYSKCVRSSLQPDCSRKHSIVTVYN